MPPKKDARSDPADAAAEVPESELVRVEPESETPAPQASAAPEEQPGETDVLQGEIADLQDRLLRTAAEFENYKKRQHREREEFLRYRYEPLVRELLPVLDSFERAIRSSEGARDYQAFHDGVELILNQLGEVLRRAGVEREEPEGEPFDPHRHEAVATMPSEDVEADHIAVVVEPGYHLHDRVVRPAKVVVSQGSASAQDGDDS